MAEYDSCSITPPSLDMSEAAESQEETENSSSMESAHLENDESDVHLFQDFSYCNEDNKEERFESLKKEFLKLKHDYYYPSSLTCASLGLDTATLINMCYDLLRFHNGVVQHNELLTDSLSKSSNEINRLSKKCSSLLETIESKDRVIQQQKEKIRQLQVAVRSLEEQLKKEREENKKMASALEHRMNHFKHDQRKKEREIEQLKEKLYKILTDAKGQQTLPMIEVINELPKQQNGQRKRWRTPLMARQQEHELNRCMMGLPALSDETHRKELLEEIQALSNYLTEAKDEIALIFKQLGIELNMPCRHTSSDDDKTIVSAASELADCYRTDRVIGSWNAIAKGERLTDNFDHDKTDSKFSFTEPADFRNNVVDALRFLRKQIATRCRRAASEVREFTEENVNNNIPCQMQVGIKPPATT